MSREAIQLAVPDGGPAGQQLPFTADPPFERESLVTAAFTDLAGVHPLLRLTHRIERSSGLPFGGRPSVAAGGASFLVAWSQGASDVATTTTEIRAVRATRAAGSLDPDGGVLLATSPTQITGGPVVAFDGTRFRRRSVTGSASCRPPRCCSRPR